MSIPTSALEVHYINFLKQNNLLVSIDWSLQHVDPSSSSFAVILSIKKTNQPGRCFLLMGHHIPEFILIYYLLLLF